MISNADRRKCFIVGGSIFATYYISKKLYNYYLKCQITKKIEKYNQKRYLMFDQVKTLTQQFTDDADVLQKRQTIIEMSFESLRSSLQNDEYTPTEVLQAFQWKALEAHRTTNCVCEFLSEANMWAAELEGKYKNSKTKPPLYGIPVSFKECYYIKGYYATAGVAQFIDKPADSDCEWMDIMKSLGAVPFVTTNIPQTMMSVGSSNPIYGVTTNPYNADLSSGGSSSGEGALIGCRGSFLGIGGDIGGSVRVPAHCCGICSLKPTVGRLPMGIARHPDIGISLVPATSGPMGVDVDSLIWFCRSVWNPDTKIVEPTVIPLPFRDDVLSSKSKLTIGYYDYDGYVQTTPACKRAVRIAKETLESLGHKLVRFDPPDVPELMRLYAAAVLPDSGRYLGRLLTSDGALDPHHRKMARFCSMPLALKKIIGFLFGSMRFGSFAANTSEMLNVFNEFLDYKIKFIDLWQSSNLDCVLCPVMASTALTPQRMAQLFVFGWNYTALYNALNFPAGVIPCIMTSKADDESMKSYKADDYYSRLVKKSFETADKKSAPIGVQLVTLPYQEELCLRIMKELEVGLKNRLIH